MSSLPRLFRSAISETNFPRRFFWRHRSDLIWVDFYKRRVTKFGAILDGERFGDDPEQVKVGDAYNGQFDEAPKPKDRDDD